MSSISPHFPSYNQLKYLRFQVRVLAAQQSGLLRCLDDAGKLNIEIILQALQDNRKAISEDFSIQHKRLESAQLETQQETINKLQQAQESLKRYYGTIALENASEHRKTRSKVASRMHSIASSHRQDLQGDISDLLIRIGTQGEQNRAEIIEAFKAEHDDLKKRIQQLEETIPCKNPRIERCYSSH